MEEQSENRSRGYIVRWRQLAPAGRRRVGEFVGNMCLGMAASLLTLLVLPAFAGRGPSEPVAVVAALVFSAFMAILAVVVRLFTEERSMDMPAKAESR